MPHSGSVNKSEKQNQSKKQKRNESGNFPLLPRSGKEGWLEESGWSIQKPSEKQKRNENLNGIIPNVPSPHPRIHPSSKTQTNAFPNLSTMRPDDTVPGYR
jgi:hypothetical protein